jgi:hypothetical protein
MIQRDKWHEVRERERRYLFVVEGGSHELKFPNVIRIRFSRSDTHWLEMADGRKAIVPSGWVALLIDADEWSLQ